jgi:NADPH2:quinone reductase
LAKRAGATVYATASSNDRLERLKDFGLDHGINYAEVDFETAIRELTGGRGVDVVVDSIGGPTLQKSLRTLAYRGRCISFGDAGREGTDKFDISTLRGNNQRLIGYFLGAELFMGTRAYDMISTLLDDVARGELQVVIDKTFPLQAAGEAHAYIEDRLAFGRVVLVP